LQKKRLFNYKKSYSTYLHIVLEKIKKENQTLKERKRKRYKSCHVLQNTIAESVEQIRKKQKT